MEFGKTFLKQTSAPSEPKSIMKKLKHLYLVVIGGSSWTLVKNSIFWVPL